MATVHVGNLPRGLTATQLEAAFAPHGRVLEVKRPADPKTGALRAFAFVELATEEAARAAVVALNGTTLGERALVVSHARPRPAEARPFAGGDCSSAPCCAGRRRGRR